MSFFFFLDILITVPGQTTQLPQVISLRPTMQNSQTLTGEQAMLVYLLVLQQENKPFFPILSMQLLVNWASKQLTLGTFSELPSESILERDSKENFGVNLYDFPLFLSFKKLGDWLSR